MDMKMSASAWFFLLLAWACLLMIPPVECGSKPAPGMSGRGQISHSLTEHMFSILRLRGGRIGMDGRYMHGGEDR
jgi:hypothetical protein